MDVGFDLSYLRALFTRTFLYTVPFLLLSSFYCRSSDVHYLCILVLTRLSWTKIRLSESRIYCRLLHSYRNSPTYISLHVRHSAQSTCKASTVLKFFSLLCLCIYHNVCPLSMYINTLRSCTLPALTKQVFSSFLSTYCTKCPGCP